MLIGVAAGAALVALVGGAGSAVASSGVLGHRPPPATAVRPTPTIRPSASGAVTPRSETPDPVMSRSEAPDPANGRPTQAPPAIPPAIPPADGESPLPGIGDPMPTWP